MKIDTIFYNLFQESPSTFFELSGYPETDANAYQFTSVELKQTSFRIDGLRRPTVETSPIYFVRSAVLGRFYSLFSLIRRFLYLHQYPSNQG